VGGKNRPWDFVLRLLLGVVFGEKANFRVNSMKQLLHQVFNWKQIQRLILPLIVMMATQLVMTPVARATGAEQMPNLKPGDHTWVIDQAEVLSRLNEGTLNKKLDDLAKQTGNEVRIVTIRRLDYGETVESFTNQLFEKWFSTPVAQANQTILVIDTLTNGTVIRTGDKVKSLLPEEIAKSVTSETVLEPLRSGDKYNQAMLDASDRLIAVLSGKPDPGPPEIAEAIDTESTFKKAEETDRGNATIWVVGLLLAATIIPMATYYLYQVIQS